MSMGKLIIWYHMIRDNIYIYNLNIKIGIVFWKMMISPRNLSMSIRSPWGNPILPLVLMCFSPCIPISSNYIPLYSPILVNLPPQKKTSKNHLTGTSTIHPPYIRTISHCKRHGGSNSSPPCAPLSPAAAKTMRHLADKAPGFCPGEKRCAVDFFNEYLQETRGTPYNCWWTYVKTICFSVGFPWTNPLKGIPWVILPAGMGREYIFGSKKYVFSIFDPPKLYENDEQQKRLI